MGPGGCCTCCAVQQPFAVATSTYVGPVGIPAPIGLGFGSVEYGCCGCCILGCAGCCGSLIMGCSER